jgi:CYTH domain-containing protein
VSVSLKYAVVERERRFLLASLPQGVVRTRDIIDRYVTGTRLRLREVREDDGTVLRKLGHKVRLGESPAEVACTNFYLDDQEWAAVSTLPARVLRKKRHMVHRDGLQIAIDLLEDGTLIAEIDDGDRPSDFIPDWLDVVEDVSGDERWTGASLAAVVLAHEHGIVRPGE